MALGESLSAHSSFRLAKNRSASFNHLDFMKELEREALSAHSSFRLAENHSLSFNHLNFVKDLEREALSPPIFSGLPEIVPHLSIDSIL